MDGATLYKTSLKDGVIVLSFISPQVGQRPQVAIDALAQQIGWPLAIHPQPNPGLILDTVRRPLQEQAWRVAKGPSIFLDRGGVAVTLAAAPAADALAALQAEFEAATGYRLSVTPAAASAVNASAVNASPVNTSPVNTSPVNASPVNASPVTASPSVAAASAPVVEIAVEQIRVRAAQQSTALNPAKLDNAIQRARRDGRIAPPIVVRRLRDGYLLVDGLYRLRAAQAVRMERVAAVVEG